jgi:hypothetical protein
MRITTIIQGLDGQPVVGTEQFSQDYDALSEIWRLLSSSNTERLVDVSWERADGVIVEHDELRQWARER